MVSLFCVQVYGESVEAFRVTSTVECVGVLSKHPVLTLFEGGEDGEEGVVGETAAERSAHCPPPSLVPRLHCILVTSLSHTNPLLPRQLPLPLPRDGMIGNGTTHTSSYNHKKGLNVMDDRRKGEVRWNTKAEDRREIL